MPEFTQAKYSDVPEGVIFFFATDQRKEYPKKKRGLGHFDIRDEVSNSHGDPDWDVLIPQNAA